MPTQHIALIAALNAQDDVLLLKRKSDAHCPDVWSFPGGKVENNEETLAAAKRELTEETGLQGENWLLLGQSEHHYPELDLTFSFYTCHCKSTAQLQAESEYQWWHLTDIKKAAMPEANAALIQVLLAYKP